MHALSQHYGLPALRNASVLPPANRRDSEAKVEVISCETREKLEAVFNPGTAKLFGTLARHRREFAADNRPPPVEPLLEEFAKPQLCGKRELSLGELEGMASSNYRLVGKAARRSLARGGK